ncbi:MAG: DNA-binding protein WhiA [Tindallia sp. MSAO_Bac2]|nr:MAG: DNA-binding protein WhiA [Tindallia sp. MSAO_Bac2]
MSFSTEMKEELARILPENQCCQLAELSGILSAAGSIDLKGRDHLTIHLSTENPSTARKIFKLIKLIFSINTEIQVRQTNRFRKSKQYSLWVKDTEDSKKILLKTKLITMKNGSISLKPSNPSKLFLDQGCQRAFLRGAFLGSGSISAPEKNYHLEYVSDRSNHLQDIQNILKVYEIDGRIIERKGYYVLYIKEGEQIVDLLNIIGAHNALLELENIRILKQMRNDINRIVNCETANLSKTVQASMKQVEMIKYIDQRIGIDQLSPVLRSIAVARLKYPEASLKELGEQLNPPIGKSGVNHRFRKLEQIEKKLRNRKKETG